jgi:hypothetical protein
MTTKQQEYEEQVKAAIDREEAIKNICDVSNLGDYETIPVTTPEGKEIKAKLYGR